MMITISRSKKVCTSRRSRRCDSCSRIGLANPYTRSVSSLLRLAEPCLFCLSRLSSLMQTSCPCLLFALQTYYRRSVLLNQHTPNFIKFGVCHVFCLQHHQPAPRAGAHGFGATGDTQPDVDR